MQGHTLMEVLAALGLSAMVIGAALSVLQTTRQHGRHLIDAAQQRLDVYAALSVLAAHGRLAGYGMAQAKAHPDVLKAPSATIPKALPKLARDNPRLAVFGDLGDAWSGVRRRADGPQPVPGSERLKLRYVADKVSVWLSTKNKPEDCEGVHIWRDTGVVMDANMQVLSHSANGEPGLYCATDAWRAGRPLVPNTGSMRFAYWLNGEMRPRGLKEMTEADWVRVIGFDVCLTMQGAGRKRQVPGSNEMSRQGMGHGKGSRRGGGDGGGGADRCDGPHEYSKTIALRNTLPSEVILKKEEYK
jgi:type II secretory pathway component PulJ